MPDFKLIKGKSPVRWWLIGLLLAGLLAACGENRGPRAVTVVGPDTATVAARATPESTPTPGGSSAATATGTAATAPTDMATATATPTGTETATPAASPTATPTLHPLSIAAMRQRSYPGSAVVIEQTLEPGLNYRRYIASYQSEGLKIYAMLTVPNGAKPTGGWPVIIFNHGYIPPSAYQTTTRYVAYVDALASHGYIVFKSDYRGHGNSEGSAGGAYGAPDYVVDVLNALGAMERYPDADPSRIGMWGHSMGGYITLRSMVISQDIKAGVIWSGVVGSYPDLLAHWHPRQAAEPPTTATPAFAGRGWRSWADLYGSPLENPAFWDSISATSFVGDLSGPLQLHHDLADSEVPAAFSQSLYQDVLARGKTAELYTYPGDDHNLAHSFGLAMQRTIEFFDRYLKGP
jgi:fermentation-respiration switch protein FrsA (DUF1100 family)